MYFHPLRYSTTSRGLSYYHPLRYEIHLSLRITTPCITRLPIPTCDPHNYFPIQYARIDPPMITFIHETPCGMPTISHLCH
ncbi:hypothetical protein RHMOL_Rhmol05G0148500 [Rhododendron molle]|uniref:Uncharacterized protein n=1 Tax=Rhododendron molle TaxID=49168 RepID=A0ACC0NQQ9_RHOML|nr:hypothetical protein RHMOL_Rhmol05G0148500 [Rhododendron molle]